LLIMPAILIVIMALVQDAPFKDYHELHLDLLLADNDGGVLAKQIINGLKQSNNFHIIDSADHKPLSEPELKKLLQKGNYQMGIVVPKGVTAEMVNASNIVVNNISRQIGLGNTLPMRGMRGGMYIRIYFDPVTKPAFRTIISTSLDKYITYSYSSMLLHRLSLLTKGQNDTGSVNSETFKQIFQGIGIKEEPLNNDVNYLKYENSVQHNVPAWAIFGMFFIVVPICSHLIKEREEGSAMRIQLISDVYKYVITGKIIFYTMICVIQFALMCCIGLWVLPLLHLPSLYLGQHAWLLLPVAAGIGFAATSYGYFVGAVFKTINQAMPFGSLSIVILSALGGIWIPVEIMPVVLQHIASLSPLQWSLMAVNEVILRNGQFTDIIKPMLLLTAFGIVLWIISIYLNTKRFKSVE
jgi:ABC-2 type transport system permease protein